MRDTGYGSEPFLRAARIAAACAEIDGRGPGPAWRRLRAGSLRLAWYRRRLPTIEVRPSASPAGAMIAEHFAIRDGRRYRYRRAQGVLPLPAELSEYMRGRSRQAVRTNVSHARKAGMTIETYADDEWVPGAGDFRVAHIAPGPVEWWNVLFPDGGLAAQAILCVDEDVALLHGLISHTSNARWLLHTAIVERLCGTCDVLLVNSDDVHLMSAGNQHFQRLLGYEVARLRILPPARPRTIAAPEPVKASWWPRRPRRA